MTAKRTLSIGLVLVVGLAILPAVTVTAQDRQDRRMDVINDTDRVVLNFYATNSSIKNWGRDLLGKDVIDPKQSYRFDFNDGTGRCMFDLRAVLDNGRVFERYRVNVCTASSWRLFGQGADDARPPTPSGKERPQPPKKERQQPPSSKERQI